MSNDFDVPKYPQPPISAGPRSERRRSARSNGYVPIFVYGHAGPDAPFHEEAYSAVVSDCGALLIMTTPVPIGEKLLLINKVTQVEQECRVVRIGDHNGPNIEIAIEFTGSAQQFWRLAPGPHRNAPVELIETRRKTL